MANASFASNFFASTERAVRRAAERAFDYILRNLKVGPIEDRDVAGNLSGIWYQVTTSSVADEEFSFRHQLNQVPATMLIGLPLNVANAQIVPLQISQAADSDRVYLKSSSTGAIAYVYIEP